MAYTFGELLQRSYEASWVILVIICVRRIFTNMPKKYSCMLWGLVGFRLVFPFSVKSKLSIIPQIEIGDKLFDSSETISSVNMVGNQMLQYEKLSTNPSFDFASIIGFIWLIGMGIILLISLIQYYILKQKTRVSVRLMNNVFLCDDITVPFVMGLRKPNIYIPSGVAKEDIPYILQHENAHIYRKDYFWKTLGYIIVILYWFCPIIVLAYSLMCNDIEYACDEKVVKDMEFNERTEYAKVLLNCSTGNGSILYWLPSFGTNKIKGRVEKVYNYKKHSKRALVCTGLLFILLGTTLLTDPKEIVNAKNEQNTVLQGSYWNKESGLMVFFIGEEVQFYDIYIGAPTLALRGRYYVQENKVIIKAENQEVTYYFDLIDGQLYFQKAQSSKVQGHVTMRGDYIIDENAKFVKAE